MKWIVRATHYHLTKFMKKYIALGESWHIISLNVSFTVAILSMAYMFSVAKITPSAFSIIGVGALFYLIFYFSCVRPAIGKGRGEEVLKDNRYDTIICEIIAILIVGSPLILIYGYLISVLLKNFLH